MFDANKLYTPEQVRNYLQIGKSSLEELIKAKTLPVVRISCRIRRFTGKSLNDLIELK